MTPTVDSETATTTLSQSIHLDHIHPKFGVEQIGWIGQSGRVYPLDKPPYGIEPGSFSPLYQPRGEICGHVIRELDQEDPE
jgi:hypothetical protein